jgi:hypothetical protein
MLKLGILLVVKNSLPEIESIEFTAQKIVGVLKLVNLKIGYVLNMLCKILMTMVSSLKREVKGAVVIGAIAFKLSKTSYVQQF